MARSVWGRGVIGDRQRQRFVARSVWSRGVIGERQRQRFVVRSVWSRGVIGERQNNERFVWHGNRHVQAKRGPSCATSGCFVAETGMLVMFHWLLCVCVSKVTLGEEYREKRVRVIVTLGANYRERSE